MDILSLLRQLSPNIRVALDHRAKGIVLNKRIIFDYELLYLEKGELVVEIQDKTYKMFPGDIILFRPGKEHGFISVGAEEAWMPHIHFDVLNYPDFCDIKVNFKTLAKCSQIEKNRIRPDTLGVNGLDIPDIIRIENHCEILRRLKRIIYHFERRDPKSILVQKSLILEILYEIMLGLEAGNSQYTSRHSGELDGAVSYILDHYNERIRLENLAKTCCLSTQHFERLFKRRYHVSPSKYIIRHRIVKAKEMMLYSKMSLCDISEKVGYSSIHAFSKAFKKAEGISPSEYMKLI